LPDSTCGEQPGQLAPVLAPDPNLARLAAVWSRLPASTLAMIMSAVEAVEHEGLGQ
jgi:hypothetical protein